MSPSSRKLLALITIEAHEDLLPVAQAEDWHTVIDLLRKTRTSFNTHWNGKHVLDLDDTPWVAGDEDLAALTHTQGDVVILFDSKYHMRENVPLYLDTDGSFYVLEDDIKELLSESGLA